MPRRGLCARHGERKDLAAPGLVLEAAAAGDGVALALSSVAAADVAAGRLVRPFAVAVPTPFAYYVVCPQATAERPKVAAFRKWLHAEAG